MQSGRRRFVRRLAILTLGAQLPWAIACQGERSSLATGGVLSSEQAEIADFIFDFIIPEDSFGPSSRSIRAYPYFLWVLQDELFDSEQQDYLIGGLNWVAEYAVEQNNQPFHTLSKGEKRALLQQVASLGWGESWLSSMLTIGIEAMLGDPIYGCNPEGVGWDWLQHNPGTPRPDMQNRYPFLLRRKEEHLPITKIEQL